MDIEIYCDESNQQLLAKSETGRIRYFLIGGLWLPSSKRQSFKEGIAHIRDEFNCRGEIKWNAVCPSKLSFYLRLIDFFFAQGLDLRFRCIVVNSQKVDLERYHDADQELGFYKFCYQFLKNWIEDFNTYSIFFDAKTNRKRGRLQNLEMFLRQSNRLAKITGIQALPSKEVAMIQLADLILGAVSAKFNDSVTSQAKIEVINRIESHLHCQIVPTNRGVRKFNVFKIDLPQTNR